MPHRVSNTAKILIVEDDRFLSELLGDILASEGYMVDFAANGNEALDKLKVTQYNTVLLDLAFHKTCIQGIEVLQYLQQTAPLLPVIVISGRASDETILQTVHSGAYSFILKPVHDLDNLLMKVAEAIQKDKLSNHLSGTLSAESASDCTIEGITSDMHIFVRQYVMYFEQFAAHFKGERVKLQVTSAFDSIKIRFENIGSSEKMLGWLREYLMFSESTELNPLIETMLTREELGRFMAELSEQVIQFTANIANAFKRMPVKTESRSSASESVLFVNPLKIKNRFDILQQDADSKRFRKSALATADKALKLLGHAYTVEAMSLLLEHCEQYDLRTTKNTIIQQQYRYTETVNRHIKGLLSDAEYAIQISRIINVLLFDIIPGIEKMQYRERA